MKDRSEEAATVCALCGEAEGHTKRCSVTRFNAPEMRTAEATDPVLAAAARAPMGPPESAEERASVLASMAESRPDKATDKGEVDPSDPYWHGRPLWVVYGPKCSPTFISAKLYAYTEKHVILPVGQAGPVVCIWGYSVYKREPGYRTLGISITELEKPHIFADQDAALSHLKRLTTPMGDAGRIG